MRLKDKRKKYIETQEKRQDKQRERREENAAVLKFSLAAWLQGSQPRLSTEFRKIEIRMHSLTSGKWSIFIDRFPYSSPQTFASGIQNCKKMQKYLKLLGFFSCFVSCLTFRALNIFTVLKPVH